MTTIDRAWVSNYDR